MSRREGPDRPLLIVTALLVAFGLLMLYSAGQTDAPTNAAGAWVRQLVWVGAGIVAAGVASGSPRDCSSGRRPDSMSCRCCSCC